MSFPVSPTPAEAVPPPPPCCLAALVSSELEIFREGLTRLILSGIGKCICMLGEAEGKVGESFEGDDGGQPSLYSSPSFG